MINQPQISFDADKEYSMCFGCGQDNPIGLKLNFQWDGNTAKAEFNPTRFHQGWPGIIHGGIIACILDEAMGYTALSEGMNCVTAEMQVKLRRPALIGETLVITASVTKKTRKLVETKANISLKDGTQIAEGTGKHFVIKTKMGEAGNKRAVIWDMDGIIVDTAQYHLEGWQIVFRKRGANYTEADFWRNTGKRSDTIIKSVLGGKVSQGEIKAIIQEKDENFRQLMGQNIRPFPGVTKLITSLKKNGFKIAIASSAPMENIQLITRNLKIYNRFDVVVTGWEVTRGKPDPQTFLLAAEKLGVEVENCIVIEDAISGVTASKRAGMHCIAVTNTTPREELREADLIIDTLEEVTIDDLDSLLHQQK